MDPDPDAPAPEAEPIPEGTLRFVGLSVPLTGFPQFELHATGMAQLYLDTARQQVGRNRFDTFLDSLSKACTPWFEPSELTDTDREIARAITYLWYTGAWPKLSVDAHADLRRQMANTEFVVAPSAYVEGLVWRTFHGHPVGAKPPGYATWGTKPAEPPSVGTIIQECGLPQKAETPAPDKKTATPGAISHLPGPRPARDIPPSAVSPVPTPRTERKS